MSYKIFIDGSAGTTGLRIAERLKTHPAGFELLSIEEEERKNVSARLERIAAADVSILCLPDDGAMEIVRAVDEQAAAGGVLAKARIIDCSTAHRTAAGWVYGLPEAVGAAQGKSSEIANAGRVANPGCHATGFLLAAAPLVASRLVPQNAQFSCYSLTGYSGGGKKMIEEYEGRKKGAGDLLAAPRAYALSQAHKHLPEMTKYAGLEKSPIFSPIVADFYSGMLTAVSLPVQDGISLESVHSELAAHYANSPFVHVRALEYNGESGFLSAAAFAGRDDAEIIVCGADGDAGNCGDDENGSRITVFVRFDNLGKGASGAAIQNLNIMLGLPEAAGLNIGE